MSAVKAPQGLSKAGQVLWRRYAARAPYVAADASFIEILVRLHERLDQVTAELDLESENGKQLMVPTVRGTTAHPLIGHERELLHALRIAIANLDRRAGAQPQESPTAELERRLDRRLRSVS